MFEEEIIEKNEFECEEAEIKGSQLIKKEYNKEKDCFISKMTTIGY